MSKWYENIKDGIVVSTKVSLSRNIKDIPFVNNMNSKSSKKSVKLINDIFFTDEQILDYEYVEVNKLKYYEKLAMVENHTLTKNFLKRDNTCGIIKNADESVNIMINEKDHIKIQSIALGTNIKKAFDVANEVDDFIEENISYAFDPSYGYLTTSLENVGTGLECVYTMHLPFLERSGQIGDVILEISNFGVDVRGAFGNVPNNMGALYNVSNKTSIGMSEDDIINNLKKISKLIAVKEKRTRDKYLEELKMNFYDNVYRSYGILMYARRINMREAMEYLSNIRVGFALDILDVSKPIMNVYNIMINIQLGNLQGDLKTQLSESEQDEVRAKYIRECLINS